MTNLLPFTHTLCHSRWQTPSHSHPCSNFPGVSAVSSLQCDSPLSPPPPRRIIEYRSLGFLPQCVSECSCGRVNVWLGPSKVIAMATGAWGPLAVLSESTGDRGHMKRESNGGKRKRGGEGGCRWPVQFAAPQTHRKREREGEQAFMVFYSTVHSDRTGIITEQYRRGSEGFKVQRKALPSMNKQKTTVLFKDESVTRIYCTSKNSNTKTHHFHQM